MRRHRSKTILRFVVATLMLGMISLLACDDDFSVEEIYIRPSLPVEVGSNAKISVRIRHQPEEVSYRWRSKNGLCEPQESRELYTIYTALRAGTDQVWFEVLDSGVVIHREEIAVAVVAPNSETPPHAREPPPSEPSGAGAAVIRITDVPPYDKVGGGTKQARIAGVVSGEASGQRVVVYACTNVCYVQPLIAAPYTEILPDDSWSNWTHTGEVYVALLVEPDFEPKPTVPGPRAPMPGVLARTVVEGLRMSSP